MMQAFANRDAVKATLTTGKARAAASHVSPLASLCLSPPNERRAY